MIRAKQLEYIDESFIIDFIDFVHRGTASFLLRKSPRQEFLLAMERIL